MQAGKEYPDRKTGHRRRRTVRCFRMQHTVNDWPLASAASWEAAPASTAMAKAVHVLVREVASC